MPGFATKRLEALRQLLGEYVSSEAEVSELMRRIGEELGVEEEREKEREKRRAYNERVRQRNGGSTYTPSDRAYYEKHKEELKSRMTERRQRLRPGSPE